MVLEEPDHLVAVKYVSRAEEYLGDHFPTFPVLPGVMMVEAMVQAARRMLSSRASGRLVLGEVRALKFGSFVRPGEALEVDVRVSKDHGDGTFQCRGSGRVIRNASGPAGSDPSEAAVSGRFTMRPLRTTTA
ncbi:MAG: hypothetical protein KDA25_13430 [Phycisphaerales bacterium]|nr:hypothetical protein [Phycisphaerales bacterium]